MAIIKYATFEVLSAVYADAAGKVPGDALFKSAHRHHFDYEPKPGYLYVRSRAISSRTNDNFDTFPAHSIKEAWRSFIGKPVFVNHHNANHRRARGVVLDAALHEDTAPDGSPDTWVEALMEVDAVRFPKLAEAIVKRWIDRTSMGTEVAISTCSFCGNQAANPTQYCRHIPAMKGQRIIRTTGTRREAVLVTEICEGLHFFENSLLVEPPADPTAYTFGIDTRGLANEKATAHLVRTSALREVLAEEEPMAFDFTDFEIIEAEAILAAINGTGPCRAYGCSCQSYRSKGQVGSYETCVCGHSQNTHSGGDQPGGGIDTVPTTRVRKIKRKGSDEPQWLINGVPFFPGRWIEVESGLWYRGSENHEIPSSLVVARKDGGWVWEARVHTFIGAPHERKNPTGKAKTLEAAQAKAEASIVKDHEAFTKYQDRQRAKISVQRKTARWPSDDGWYSEDPEYHSYDKEGEGGGGGTVSEQLAGNPLTPTGRWEYDAYRYDDLSQRHRGVADSLEAAKAEVETYVNGGQMSLFGSLLKGAPFAGYADFEACVRANQDKGDPNAYCGYIKHHVEDAKKTSALDRFFIHTADGARGPMGYGKVVDANLGRCYELSAQRVVFGPGRSMMSGYLGAHLLHGTIQGFGQPPLEHAWVQEPNGDFWEPATDTVYSPEDYERLFNPEVWETYDVDQTRLMMVQQGHYGPWRGEFLKPVASLHTGLGEMRAPAQVDTLRLDQCPVCGDDDGFDGEHCRVCGFVKPPAMFDDPDVEKAKQVDLRGGDVDQVDDVEEGQTPAEVLQCDNCGKTFPLDNEAKAVDTTKPGAGALNPVPSGKSTAKPPAGGAPVKKKAPPFPPKKSAFGDADTAAKPTPETGFGEQVPPDQQDTSSGDLHDGSTCPACGIGTLHTAPAGASTDDAMGPDVEAPDEQQPPAEDQQQPPEQNQQQPQVHPDDQQQGGDEAGTQPGVQPPAKNPAKPDHSAPPFAKKDDEDEDGKKKNLPPWLRKKKTSHLAGQSKETVDMTTNPAQENRNRLLTALAEQQEMIETQGVHIEMLREAMVTLATAAGVIGHPHFAALVVQADEVATTSEQALKPDAKDDPQNVGAAPAGANEGVTPDATTDVSNSNVAVPQDATNQLVDVTSGPPADAAAPPKGRAAHTEVDVKAPGPNNNNPFPNNSGWKSSALEEEPAEDPQVRFMASLRLAKARKEAGISEDGVEEVTAAQVINDDATFSLALIQHEINTLAAIAAHRPTQQVQASRATVPQRAEVPRTMPSLSAQGSAGVVTHDTADSQIASAQMRDTIF